MGVGKLRARSFTPIKVWVGVVGGSGWPNLREVLGDHSVSLDEFELNNSFAVGLVEFLAHWQVMMLMQWSIGKCLNVFFASGSASPAFALVSLTLPLRLHLQNVNMI